MTDHVCIGCWTDHDLRLLLNSPIAADEGLTCICRACYGAEPKEPPFETLPTLSGLPAAADRMGGETSPEAQVSGAFKEPLTWV